MTPEFKDLTHKFFLNFLNQNVFQQKIIRHASKEGVRRLENAGRVNVNSGQAGPTVTAQVTQNCSWAGTATDFRVGGGLQLQGKEKSNLSRLIEETCVPPGVASS